MARATRVATGEKLVACDDIRCTRHGYHFVPVELAVGYRQIGREDYCPEHADEWQKYQRDVWVYEEAKGRDWDRAVRELHEVWIVAYRAAHPMPERPGARAMEER